MYFWFLFRDLRELRFSICESVKALAEADEKLQLEIAARKRAEELLKAPAELELRIDQGTAVLATEIAERKPRRTSWYVAKRGCAV